MIKATSSGLKRNALYRGRVEILDNKIKWTVNRKVIGFEPLQSALVYPTRVHAGMEWCHTEYDNLTIVGVLDKGWLQGQLKK